MLLKSKDATKLSARAYDRMLAAGWFRGARFMNKPEYICVNGDLFSPVHVRLPLTDYTFSKSLKKIVHKNDSNFRWVMCPAEVDDDAEQLYIQQKEDFQAFIYPSLEEALYSSRRIESFKTYSIRVYDEDKLVAISFFDIGVTAMASLLGLYDKAYLKSSLGNYTILKEIEIAKRLNLKYYYPGYVLSDLKVFGYKLRFGNFEYKTEKGRWKSITKYALGHTDADKYKETFGRIIQKLKEYNIEGSTRIYPLHYAFNPSLEQSQFYRYPIFSEVVFNQTKYAVSFDPEKNTIVWSQIVKSPLHHRLLMGLEISNDLKKHPAYEMHLLEAIKEVHVPLEVLDQLEISSVTPTGQWSDPITSFNMKASFK